MALISSIFDLPALYHFTDHRNLSFIREVGGLLSLRELKRLRVEPPAPGGNQWSRDADARSGMDAFVHLCFRRNHPMEIRAREDGRIVKTIFLEISPAVLRLDGVRFTLEVANKSGVASHPVGQVDHMIDFEVLYSRTDWRDPVVKQRLLAAEKYEILVPDLSPLSLIRNLHNG